MAQPSSGKTTAPGTLAIGDQVNGKKGQGFEDTVERKDTEYEGHLIILLTCVHEFTKHKKKYVHTNILYPYYDKRRDIRSNIPPRLKKFPRAKPEGRRRGIFDRIYQVKF